MRPSRITFTLPFIFLVGCASSPKATCPRVEEEAISVCRAQAKCKDQNSSVGVGLGIGLGRGFGVGVGGRQSTDRYTNCVDQDLKAQEAQAKQRDSSLPEN
ncbi:MAG: hypothetical protein KF789_14255 [Bdellovibrionaceae bacterium]|nr:hypothetical protein [Pseudobdellovibrionaceae bacterium]